MAGEGGFLVLGDGPVAAGLAAAWSERGRTVLGGERPVSHSTPWRRVSLATGEGVRSAVADAKKGDGRLRVAVVVEPDVDISGLMAVLKPTDVPHAALVDVGPGQPVKARAGWSYLALGPVWGATHPWAVAWRRAASRGERLWVPKLGPLAVLQTAVAVAAVHAAASGDAPVRWTLGADQTLGLHALVRTVVPSGAKVSRAPLWWAARQVGRPAQELTAWAQAQPGPTDTPGWTPQDTAA